MRKPAAPRSFTATWVHSVCGLLLVCTSIAHRMQLDTSNPAAYTSGPLLGFEIVLLVALLALLVVIAPVRGLFFLFQKRWRDLGMLAINVLIGFVSLALSIAIDAPTLLYAT